MTTLLQLNLNIRQGCSKGNEDSPPIEARLSNWTTGVPEPLATRVMAQTGTDSGHAPPRRDTRSALPRCLQLHPASDMPRKRSGMPTASASPSADHLSHQLGSSRAADQFFFSNMLRNLLHRSRIGHQRHQSDYSTTGPQPLAKRRRTVDKTPNKMSEQTSNSKPTPPQGTNIDFSFDNPTQKYKFERGDDTKKSPRPPMTSSPPATALDLSISGGGGSTVPSTSSPSELLWWCPSAGISPMIPWPGGPAPSPPSQQHHHTLRTPTNPPMPPPVHPWDAAGVMALLPPDLAAAVQSTPLDHPNVDADHLASHQRLWNKIWRDVPLGELWLRQHLASPQPPPSCTPPNELKPLPSSRRSTKRQGDLPLSDDPDHSCQGRQTNHVKRRRIRSHVMQPHRTRTLDGTPDTTMVTFDSRMTPSDSKMESSNSLGKVSCSKMTANFGPSTITSGSSRTSYRSIDQTESSGRHRRSSASVSMARRHIKRELKVAVTGRPRFRTHHSSAFVAPSKPALASMTAPPDITGRHSLSVRESFEIATLSKALKIERGITTVTPTVHYVMTNLRSIIGCVHQVEPDLKAPSSALEIFKTLTPTTMVGQTKFGDDTGDNDCSKDDRCHPETQSSSKDQCSYHDTCDQQLQQLLEETISQTTVAPPASQLSPDCNMFSALIGLEIVVDYVQRDANSEA